MGSCLLAPALNLIVILRSSAFSIFSVVRVVDGRLLLRSYAEDVLPLGKRAFVEYRGAEFLNAEVSDG